MIRGASVILTLARGLINETLLQGERVRLLGLSVGGLQADEAQSGLFTEIGGADG